MSSSHGRGAKASWRAMESENPMPGPSGANSHQFHYRPCNVRGCKHNKQKNPDLTFFTLPSDDERRSNWLILIGREDLIPKTCHRYYCVCELHFDESDIIPFYNRKILKKTAMPSRNLPVTAYSVPSPPLQKPDSQPQTEFEIQRNLNISSELTEIVKAVAEINDSANRATRAYKLFCSKLYHISREAYIMLQIPLRLPPENVIKELAIPCSSELSPELVSTLKMNVDKMTVKEKLCAVVVGKIDLKKNLWYCISYDRIIGFHEVNGVQAPSPAATAVVVLVRGILVDWVQPLAFALLSDEQDSEEIPEWITKVVLKKLFDIGFSVKVLISDEDFVKMGKKSLFDSDDPFFYYNDKKIYYISDTPKLMKDVHAHMLSNMLMYEDKHVVKMEHIYQFYEQDKSKNVRLAEKLTENHVNPSNIKKLKVRDAKELMSKEVAAGISMYVDFNVIEKCGRETAQFLLLMSRLYNTFNQSSLHGKDFELEFLVKMMNLFHSLRFFDVNGEEVREVQLQQAFEVNIRSLLLLLEDLKAEGYEYIVPKFLNQNALKMFLIKIKLKFSKGKTPTSRQFVTGFRALFFQHKLPTGKYRNKDLKEALVEHYSNIEKDPFLHSKTSESDRHSFSEINCKDYQQLDIKPDESLFKICGHLITILSKYHKDCPEFKAYTNTADIGNPKTFLVFKEFINNNEYRLPVIPPDRFVFFVEILEKEFCDVFEAKQLCNPIASSIYERMKNFMFSPCDCFPKEYMQKLFIRLRLYFLLKHYNIALRNGQQFSM